MSSQIKAAVVLGSVRPGRLGIRAANYLMNQLKKRQTFEPTFIDPLDYQIGLEEKPLHHYAANETIPVGLKKLGEIMKIQDAFFLVSPEYNHTPGPALLNLLDHFPLSFFSGKTSGIFTYSIGPFGGSRAALALRSMMGEVGALSVSPMVHMTKIHESNQNGIYEDLEMNRLLQMGTDRLINHVEWVSTAFKTQREKFGPPQ